MHDGELVTGRGCAGTSTVIEIQKPFFPLHLTTRSSYALDLAYALRRQPAASFREYLFTGTRRDPAIFKDMLPGRKPHA